MAGRTSKKDKKILEDNGKGFLQWHGIRDYKEFYPSTVGRIPRCEAEPCFAARCVFTGKCAVCGNNLTNEFPEDYPNEWKFCCGCKDAAEELGKGTTARSQLYKVVYKKITLVG